MLDSVHNASAAFELSNTKQAGLIRGGRVKCLVKDVLSARQPTLWLLCGSGKEEKSFTRRVLTFCFAC